MGCIWPIGSGTGEAWHTHLAVQVTGKRKSFSWMREEAQPFAKPSVNMFVFFNLHCRCHRLLDLPALG